MAALNACTRACGCCEVPAGVLYTGTVFLPSDTVFRLTSSNTTLLGLPGEFAAVLPNPQRPSPSWQHYDYVVRAAGGVRPAATSSHSHRLPTRGGIQWRALGYSSEHDAPARRGHALRRDPRRP